MGDDVKRVKIGDRVCEKAPPTAADWRDFVHWVQRNYLAEVRYVATTSGLNDRQQAEAITSAVLRAATFNLRSDEVQAAIQTQEGAEFVNWLAVRVKQPDVKLEEMKTAVEVE